MVRPEIKKLWDKYRSGTDYNHEALRIDMGLDNSTASDLEIIKFQLFMLDRFCGDQHRRLKTLQGSTDDKPTTEPS